MIDIKSFFDNSSYKLLKLLPATMFGLALTLFSDQAFAVAGGRGNVVEAPGERAAYTSQTLGGLLANTFNNSKDVWVVMSAFSMLAGLIFGIMGIIKLKEHVEKGDAQVPIWDPLKRFIAGGAFFMLPLIRDVVVNTLTNENTDAISGSDYNTGGASSEGLDGKLVALMKDVWDDFHILIVGFCYLAGLILLIIAISRLLKTEQEGAKGPLGFGTIMTFLVSGALFSVNAIVSAASQTIFNSGVQASATLQYTDGLPNGGAHANAVIGAIMAFVAIIGWISFVRGFFMIRGVAEGSQQASAMAAFTHIIGGACAINLGAFIKAVQNTLGITEYGLQISSIEPYLTTVTMLT